MGRQMARLAAGLLAVGLLATGCAGGGEQTQGSGGEPAQTRVRVAVTSRGEIKAEATGSQSVSLQDDYVLRTGDTITVELTGATRARVRLSPQLEEAVVWLPDGTMTYQVQADYAREFPSGTWGAVHIQAAVAGPAVETYNLACNPYEVRGQQQYYPRVTASSEYGGNPDFFARNAIDGFTKNDGHGAYPVQSWGPDKREDLTFTLELGRPCVVHQVRLYIRADFPHDTNWSSADLVFSDGTRQTIAIEKTGEVQTFAVADVTTDSVRLENLVAAGSEWIGLTELEVLGRDAA